MIEYSLRIPGRNISALFSVQSHLDGLSLHEPLIIMVMFASLIGAVAIYAGVASAVPMDYGSSSGSGSYSPPANSYGSSNNSSGSYGNNSGSNGYGSSSSLAEPMSTPTSTSTGAYPASTPSYSTPSYGSGSSSWNNNNGGNYNNCVQQCMTQYGPPSSMNMTSSSSTPPSNSTSGSGNGVTHTVIVAPTQGVLRYVPFALNASVGDTVLFMWGANNHTVTKSSQLEICNKTSDLPFASGEQNKGFTFSQVVNDTNTTFYYCGTPTHCEKGMFGIINPPSAYQQPGSVSNMMPTLASQYPSTNASWSYTSNITANNSAAANWGMNIDMGQMPNWTMQYMAENVLYSRLFLAENPETISPDGTVDLSPLANNAITVPMDIAANTQNNAQSGTPSSSPTSSGATPTPSGGTSGALKSGASALDSPRIVVALVAVAVAIFAL